MDRWNGSGTLIVMFKPSSHSAVNTWGVQVLRYPNFFPRGMEADRNVKVVGGDVAVL